MSTPGYSYCERLGPGLLAEPLNLATGAVFLFLGLWLLRRPAQPGAARMLSLLMALTGATTMAHHAHPVWLTEVVDLLPTIAFVGCLFFAYARDVLRLAPGEALTGTSVMMPFVAGSLLLLLTLEGPIATASYAALPVFILGMAVVLRQRDAGTGLRVMLSGLALLAGLVLRALDLPLCGTFPLGTHFLWHLAAALSMGLLVCAYRRHLLAAGDAGR